MTEFTSTSLPEAINALFTLNHSIHSRMSRKQAGSCNLIENRVVQRVTMKRIMNNLSHRTKILLAISATFLALCLPISFVIYMLSVSYNVPFRVAGNYENAANQGGLTISPVGDAIVYDSS